VVQIDRLWRVPLRVSLDGSMKRAACPLHPLRDHVDDHRLVFDIVVVKAVDKGVALAGYGAAMGALFHLRHTGRGTAQGPRAAGIEANA